jgi:hypothetical protein
MADEDPADSSSWAAWANPKRWLSFAQHVFGAEQALMDLKTQNEALADRIRAMERILDRQTGQLLQLDKFIEARVALEVTKELDRRKARRPK